MAGQPPRCCGRLASETISGILPSVDAECQAAFVLRLMAASGRRPGRPAAQRPRVSSRRSTLPTDSIGYFGPPGAGTDASVCLLAMAELYAGHRRDLATTGTTPVAPVPAAGTVPAECTVTAAVGAWSPRQPWTIRSLMAPYFLSAVGAERETAPGPELRHPGHGPGPPRSSRAFLRRT